MAACCHLSGHSPCCLWSHLVKVPLLREGLPPRAGAGEPREKVCPGPSSPFGLLFAGPSFSHILGSCCSALPCKMTFT